MCPSIHRQQHGLHRGAGPAEPPAAHGQLGRLGIPGGPRGRGGPPLGRAAALLQHALPAVHRSAGSRRGRPQRQVRRRAVHGLGEECALFSPVDPDYNTDHVVALPRDKV